MYLSSLSTRFASIIEKVTDGPAYEKGNKSCRIVSSQFWSSKELNGKSYMVTWFWFYQIDMTKIGEIEAYS